MRYVRYNITENDFKAINVTHQAILFETSFMVYVYIRSLNMMMIVYVVVRVLAFRIIK